MRISAVVTAMTAFASFAAATQDAAQLLRRQTDATITSTSPDTTAASSDSSPSTANVPSTTAPTTTNNANTTHTTPTSIPASLPAAYITLLSPSTTANSPSYYPIGTPLTFIWNYTYLLATPTALDILATASAPGLAIPTPFTLALNHTFSAPQTFIWDTGAYAQQTPLPVGTYTLIVYDADAENGQWTVASAGRLSSWRGYSWGMYNTQAYTPLADGYVCATCNGAKGRGLGRETWVVLGGTVGVMMGGFLWFAGLAGLVW